MNLPPEEWNLDTRQVGRRVLVFDQLDSTSTFAASLAGDPASHGLVVVAREQTAGRGQHGRNWQCPAGDGVLLSVLLFPPPELRRPVLLTAWAAVSVCESILECAGVQAKIKWPNDVLLRGRKVCGILIEQLVRASQSTTAVVAGIGLNVRQSAERFQDAGLHDAASLEMSAHNVPDPHTVARRLIRHLDEEYTRLVEGDLTTLEACWQWRLGLLGRQVVAECTEGERRGRLVELGWNGVVLEGEDGSSACLLPESVRHLREA